MIAFAAFLGAVAEAAVRWSDYEKTLHMNVMGVLHRHVY